MQKILMIHEFYDDILKLPLDEYVLTFDDGNYTQYQGILKIKDKFPNARCILFISTGIIHDDYNQIEMECPSAHQQFFTYKDTRAFLNIEQIYELSKLPNVSIGLHGHNHLNLNILYKKECLRCAFETYKHDVQSMIDFYKSNESLFGKKIYYCRPYNIYHSLSESYLKQRLNELNREYVIFGDERIDVRELI